MTESKLQEVRDRLQKAYHELRGLLADAEQRADDAGLAFSTEVIRLSGKTEGVQLALAYVDEELRRS